MLVIYGFLDEILENDQKAENKRADESLAGRILLDLLLKKKGIDLSSKDIIKEGNRKPRLPMENVDFSVTHSNGFVACALSVGQGRVGIDAEPTVSTISPERQQAFANRFFSINEKEKMDEGKLSFSEIWTRKEAMLKQKGIGLAEKLTAADTILCEGVKISTLCVDGFVLSVSAEQDSDFELLKFER
jgi:4'-phosphopantetheinyl transferase